jgi:tRNA threonylcarbamoyl adenosine modification protein YeaZ
MITLSCETSTLLGSVALSEDGKVLASEESQRQGSHSDMLNVLVEKVLQNAGKKLTDVDVFICGIGPGSFTGIRISLNAVKTFAYCHSKPVMGGNSLASLAYGSRAADLPPEFLKLPVISMINAYKNMCYVATYRFEKSAFIEVKPPEVIRVQNLESYVTETSLVCGDGFSTYQKFFPQSVTEKLMRHPEIPDDPLAKTLGQMAQQKLLQPIGWNELLPLYLRASEAEENLQGIKYQPLI